MVDGFTGPEAVQEPEVLVEHVAADPGVGLFTAVFPFERPDTAADPKNYPAAAKAIQGCDLPGDHHGPPAG